jgi:uncharacterized membrane protein YagU involved in acid resistance
MNHRSLAKHLVAGATAGICAAWAMNEFQKTWLKVAPSGAGKLKTDIDVMQEVARRVARTIGDHRLSKPQRQAAALLLHYGFGATTGALYAVLATQSNLVRKGYGAAFGSAFFAIGDALAPSDLKPLVNDSRFVSWIYEWLTHVVYGVTLEAGRRGALLAIDRL